MNRPVAANARVIYCLQCRRPSGLFKPLGQEGCTHTQEDLVIMIERFGPEMRGWMRELVGLPIMATYGVWPRDDLGREVEL